MPVYFKQLTGSIRLKSCSASLGCPQPAPAGSYDWKKLEEDLPLSSMVISMQTAWEWMGRIDQALVIIFVPVLIMLLVKVRRLENMSTTSTPSPTTDWQPEHDRLRDRCYEAFR